jgi:hypothetical protein
MPLNEIQKQVYDGLFKIAVANDYPQASITPHEDGYVLNYRTKDHTLAALPVFMSPDDGKAVIEHLLFEGRKPMNTSTPVITKVNYNKDDIEAHAKLVVIPNLNGLSASMTIYRHSEQEPASLDDFTFLNAADKTTVLERLKEPKQWLIVTSGEENPNKKAMALALLEETYAEKPRVIVSVERYAECLNPNVIRLELDDNPHPYGELVDVIAQFAPDLVFIDKLDTSDAVLLARTLFTNGISVLTTTTDSTFANTTTIELSPNNVASIRPDF